MHILIIKKTTPNMVCNSDDMLKLFLFMIISTIKKIVTKQIKTIDDTNINFFKISPQEL